MLDGAVQLTDRLFDVAPLVATEVGAPGGSSTFVTLIVTVWVASVVPLPVSSLPLSSLRSVTDTVTA